MTKRDNSYKYLFILSFVVAIVFPLLSLFTQMNFVDIKKLFTDAQFLSIILNSILTATSTAVISITIALILALIINRSKIRFKAVFTVLLTLPMLIPSISHGMGLILLLGNNGIISNLINIRINLFGYTGIIIGSFFYTFPVAFLLLNDVFQYEDYSVYEVCDAMGIPKMNQFISITIPNLKQPLISTFFAVFTMAFTDYGVSLMVGGKVLTLATYMYREVIGLLNFSNGAIIGILLLIPAFVAFVIDLKTASGDQTATVVKEYVIKENKKRDVLAYIIIITMMLIIFAPIFSFAFLSFVKLYPNDLSFSFDHVKLATNFGVFNYLLNAITIAIITGLIGTFFSYVVAYITSRSEKDFSTQFLHLISLVSLAVPGVVLGLSYVLFFNKTFLYGGIAILIMVNIVHFFASPYLMAYNSLSNFSHSFEDVAKSLNISKFKMLVDVYAPSTKETIIEMFSYFFINAMVTISAVSFLSNLKTMPIALLIPQFDAQSLIEPIAFVSLIILAVNVIVKMIVYFSKRSMKKEIN